MKVILRIIAVAVFSALTLLPAAAQVTQYINQQNLKIPKGERPDPEEIEKEARKTIRVDIDTTTVYYQLVDSAQASAAANDWKAAEDFLMRAIRQEPLNHNNSLLLSNLATAQRNMGRLDDAIKNYSLALDLTPNAVTLLHNRAATYVLADSLALALRDYERIMLLDKKDVDSRFNHGVLALEVGLPDVARKNFEEILDIDASSPLAHQGIGNVCKAQEQWELAVAHYGKALEKITDSAPLYANRADCLLVLKRLSEASADITQAKKLDPDDPFIYVLSAKLNKMRYDYDAMERDIKSATDKGIDEQSVRRLLTTQ